MAKHSIRSAWALIAVAILSNSSSPAAEPTAAFQPSWRMATYRAASGEGYFALSLKMDLPPTASQPTDLVILFDTSASQAGMYREDALISLKTMLKFMGPSDRVKLLAVDLNAIPLTSGFVAANGVEMQTAIATLEKRVPLGSTDMAIAMESVTNSFAGIPTNIRAAVYIGDGMSRASLLGTQEYNEMVRSLVERRVSVSSYAIGRGLNVPLLAALANTTGGIIYADPFEGRRPQQAGSLMAGAVHATVAWPTATKLPASLTEALPQMVPPLRSDRDSILIGTWNGEGGREIKVTVEVGGQLKELAWMVTPEKSNGDFAFLPRLVELARKDGGVSLPTVGSEGLREAARVVQASVEQMAKVGGQALSRGDFSGARQVADAVLANDPENNEARVLRSAASKTGPAQTKFIAAGRAAESDLRMGAARTNADTFLELNPGRDLDVETQRQQLIAQKVAGEVEQGIVLARNKMGRSAEEAKLDLKLLIEQVEKTPELDAETRSRLRQKLEGAIREAGNREMVALDKRLRDEARTADANEVRKIVEATQRDQEKFKQLMDRFDALMDERQYRKAEDEIAEVIRESAPDSATAQAAVWKARTNYHIYESERLRELRHKNYTLALHSVEASHIPFPDELAIIYPPADAWEDLTRRREKYKATDLAKAGGAEERIRKVLGEQTELEFLDTPLKEVVDFLKLKHRIPVELDTKALEGAGVGTDTPVNKNLRGITLRSALRLMLKDLSLTYVIRDEVLLITTNEEAENTLITKVYPVADLVVPITAGGAFGPQGGGGFGGLPGGGGGGGGLGGGGGFGGGGLGGGLGGGQGGGGGGFFSIQEQHSSRSLQPGK